MLLNINQLRVLFLGNRNPANENIQQKLSDVFQCPVFFDWASCVSEYYLCTANKKYEAILADFAMQDFKSEDILTSIVLSGSPVIYLSDAPKTTECLSLIKRGAASCIYGHDAGQIILEIFKVLQRSTYPHWTHSGKMPNEKELLMKDILENFTDIFYVVDHEWRLTYINKKGEECWDSKREDLLGRVFWDRLSHLVLPPDKVLYELSMKRQTPMKWETTTIDKKYWGDISTYPTQDGGLAVFIRDITEKRHAEDALLVSRGRHAILLKLSDSLRLLNNTNDIQEAAARIVGAYLGVEKAFYCDVVTIDGVQYFSLQNIYSVVENHIPPGLHSIDSPGVLAQENHEGRNIVVCDMESDPRITDDIRAKLRKIRLRAWVSVPFIKNGRFVASFTVHQAIARDWTSDEISLIEETIARTWAAVEHVRAESALRKSEQHALQLVSELENADRNKNEFINALSHELRNPLAAIAASLSMLNILDSKSDTHNARNIIKRQTEQLCHMVDDLLDLTRITNNKVQLKLDLFNLNELARATAYDHRPFFEEKGVALETVISDVPLYISADPVRISQSIGNLLHNAYKFTDKGGKTTLTVYTENNEAVIVVKDNGIGIESNFLPDLFKTFRQSEHKKGGLGLGLSIVKGIIELHGGTVFAHSAGINSGATFTVKLPATANPLVKNDGITEETEHHSKSLKILIIDDNRDLAEITCALLTHYGYEVTAEYTGLDGIQRANAFLPHVIICDIGLPDIDGYEVARRISDCSEHKHVRLISLSGYAQASDFEYSREAGYAVHISKPVDFDYLKTILDAITP